MLTQMTKLRSTSWVQQRTCFSSWSNEWQVSPSDALLSALRKPLSDLTVSADIAIPSLCGP